MPAKPKDQDAMAAFADELRAWRAARGWTQGQLAAETNYSEQMIAQGETSRKPATMQMGTVLDPRVRHARLHRGYALQAWDTGDVHTARGADPQVVIPARVPAVHGCRGGSNGALCLRARAVSRTFPD